MIDDVNRAKKLAPNASTSKLLRVPSDLQGPLDHHPADSRARKHSEEGHNKYDPATDGQMSHLRLAISNLQLSDVGDRNRINNPSYLSEMAATN